MRPVPAGRETSAGVQGRAATRPEASDPASVPADLAGPRQPERSAEGAPLRDALEAIDHGVAVVSASYVIGFVNAALSRLIGIPAQRLVGRRVRDVFPAMQGRPESALVRRTRYDGTPRSYRVRYRDDRIAGTFDVRVSRAAGGDLVFEVRDASAVARLEREHSDVLESLQAAAVVLDAEWRVTHWNAAAERLIGARRAEALGRSIWQAFPVLHDSEAGRICRDVMRLREPRELRSWASSGRPGGAMLDLRMSPLEGGGILVLASGSTDAGSSEAALEADAESALWHSRLFEETRAASDARSSFLATISHELRTPLTALSGYEELLSDEILGSLSEPQHDVVERMRTVTQQLTGMIDELLTFSSLETGRESVRLAPVSTSDLVHAAVAVVEPAARQKGLALQVLLPDEPPVIVTDADKVRHILVGLAGNAVKFTSDGSVTLSLDCSPAEIRFGVRDTGIGISADAQQRLFQPFVQLEGGLTRRYGGSGLGLYIASRFAGLLGGRIEVTSTPGAGSHFELVLPSGAHSPAPPTPAASPPGA